MSERTMIDIPASTILKIIFIILSFVFIYLLRDVLMIIFFAVVIASAVEPFAKWLEGKGIPRLLGVLLLYLGFFGLGILLLSLIIPFFSFEVSQLTHALPSYISTISGALDKAQAATSTRYFDFLSEIQNILDSFSQVLQSSSQSVLNLVVGLFGGIISFVAIVIISFYFAVMPKGITAFISSILPDRYEDYVINLWHRSERKIGRWLQGQLLLALVVGLAVFISLSLLGMQYALIFGILSMFLELIPTVGPVIGAIPAVIVAFSQSTTLGVSVLILYIIIQQLESNILAPLILGKTLGLNPVTVIIALLIGAKVSGVLGMILAVPVAVVIVEILDDLAREKETRKALRAK